jgi:hypothetical protein
MIDKEITDDFCESFSTKEKCVGACAMMVPYMLPIGVDPDDERVIRIVSWCVENGEKA